MSGTLDHHSPQSPARSPRSAFASSSRSHSRPSSNRASPVHFEITGNAPNGPTSRLPTMNRGYAGRRQSRFDPMGQDDDAPDEEGYGDLGGKHPLRRVHEDLKEEAGRMVSLPGIKALFGVAGTNSNSGLYQTPSLPSLASPSSSPSTVRTSRYSSLGSSISTVSETHSHPGWWAPGEDRFASQAPRSNSFPNHLYIDEHDTKRRRSDQPQSARDSEEAARLRWQAQSRNASFPSTASSSGSISGPSGGPLRALLHPPPAASAAASAAMSRGSVSASPTVITPLSANSEFSFDRRPSAAPRSASLVGSQLARSFADLTAADQPLAHKGDMAPPPDRRASMWLPPPNNTEDRSPLPSGMRDHPRSGPGSRSGSLTPNPNLSFVGPRSLTRPSSPIPDRMEVRRSSLTELIMMKSGDDVAMAASRSHHEPLSADSGGPLEKHLAPEPAPGALWSARRASADSVQSSGAGAWADDGPTPSLRGRKRASLGDAQHLVELHQGNMVTEPVLRGMEALAESARRVAAEERKESGLGVHDLDGDDDGKNAGTGPKYACAYCAKTFSRPSSLRIHTYSHTGERPFVCKEPSCRRRFSVQSNLKRHAKVHQMGGAGNPMPSGSSGSYTPTGSRPGSAQTPTRHSLHPPQGYYQSGYYPQEQGRYAPYPGGGPGRRLSNVGEIGRRGSREEDWTEEEEDVEEDELDEDD